ncbi:Uncharacterised protein [uncultured archaeon]|nr:Uncharacterised protein [uncultured archaeon]
MFSKKAQSEIITTVLIILLVLAAIVIVWQVVQGTIKKGGDQVTKQGSCIGVAMDVVPVGATNTVFSIIRKGGGTLSAAPTIKIYKDGVETACAPWNPVAPTWTNDATAATCTFAAAATTSVEAILILSDGTACPVSGKWTK